MSRKTRKQKQAQDVRKARKKAEKFARENSDSPKKELLISVYMTREERQEFDLARVKAGDERSRNQLLRDLMEEYVEKVKIDLLENNWAGKRKEKGK